MSKKIKLKISARLMKKKFRRQVVGAKVVGKVQLGRGALVGADRLAVQLLG